MRYDDDQGSHVFRPIPSRRGKPKRQSGAERQIAAASPRWGPKRVAAEAKRTRR